MLTLNFSGGKRPNYKMWLLAFFLVLSNLSMSICDKARFDNYRIYSVKIETEEQLKLLQEFANFQTEVVFLEPPTVIGISVEILVPPHKFADMSDLFQTYGLKAEIKVNNLQRLVLQ